MSWIQSYNGIKFDLINTTKDMIDINDIAHALSLICRFNGHCKEFYSVAQHCVLMSELIEPEFALEALLHDASEAYIADLVRPIKPYVGDYGIIEANLMQSIYRAFGMDLTFECNDKVKVADNRMLFTEKAQITKHQLDWGWSAEPYDITITCWSPAEAETRFLNRFNELTKEK